MKSILGQWRPDVDQAICTSNGSTLNPQLRGDHRVHLWIGQYVLVMGQLLKFRTEILNLKQKIISLSYETLWKGIWIADQ